MKPNEIQQLIEMVDRSNISELEVSRWGKKVCIRKNSGNNVHRNSNQENYIITQAPAVAPPPQIQVSAPVVEKSVAAPVKNTDDIFSPMVGTFYRAPSPDAKPYVEIGDVVAQGQVLCIIEAMKLMNQIEAEFPCRIMEILVANAQPVEYNQPLFRVEKIK
jgi:acetyl-CoA carboxylase biotin carboxyl carrier protein